MRESPVQYRSGAMLSGVFMVLWPHRCVARNGKPYYRLRLKGDELSLKGHVWLHRHSGVDIFEQNHRYAMTGRLKNLNGDWYLDVISSGSVAEIASAPHEIYFMLKDCPVRDLLQRLKNIITLIQHESLRRFLACLFKNEDLCKSFMSCPASIGYHHNHPGGLLEHSIHCAELVAGMLANSPEQLQLGVVAALLHDIGKAKTFTPQGTFMPASGIVSHSAFNFYVMAEALHELESEWRDGFLALMHIWEWMDGDQKKSPLVSCAVAVKAADNLSCSMHNETQAGNAGRRGQRFVTAGGRKFFAMEKPGNMNTELAMKCN